MITAKPFIIAAGVLPVGGSNYQIVGTKLFLLAASEPLFIKIFKGSELVGDFSGFNGGLEAGPFCEPFTAFSLATQSGLAGNALIGIGDDDMGYNPLAGTLNFSDSATNAGALPTPTSFNQHNFAAAITVPAGVGDLAILELGNGGPNNQKNAIISGLRIYNPSAAPVNINLGLLNSFLIGIGAAGAVGGNLFITGPIYVFGLYAGVIPPAGLPNPGTFGLAKEIHVPANTDVVVDLSAEPVVLPKGTQASFIAWCDTADTEIVFSLNWSES